MQASTYNMLQQSQYVAMQGCTTCNRRQCVEARQELLRLREERTALIDQVQRSGEALHGSQAENAIMKQQAKVKRLYIWYQKLPCLSEGSACRKQCYYSSTNTIKSLTSVWHY